MGWSHSFPNRSRRFSQTLHVLEVRIRRHCHLGKWIVMMWQNDKYLPHPKKSDSEIRTHHSSPAPLSEMSMIKSRDYRISHLQSSLKTLISDSFVGIGSDEHRQKNCVSVLRVFELSLESISSHISFSSRIMDSAKWSLLLGKLQIEPLDQALISFGRLRLVFDMLSKLLFRAIDSVLSKSCVIVIDGKQVTWTLRAFCLGFLAKAHVSGHSHLLSLQYSCHKVHRSCRIPSKKKNTSQ